jgi:Domain of unknown function (DUF4345)
MPASLRVVQVCLFLFAAIALFGGCLQMYLGQPETTPRLDNIHRFLGGIYLGAGIITLWAAITVRKQGTLILFIALAGFLGGLGRLLSMSQVGIPEPRAVFLGYLVPELLVPVVIVIAYLVSRRGAAAGG